MPDGTFSVATQLTDFIKYLLTVIVAGMTWMMRRLFKRMDDLENNKVDEKVFNNTLESLRRDMKENADRIVKSNSETREDIRTIHGRIDSLKDK